MIAIFNCSPLIYLSKINALNLCHELYSRCITVPIVHSELLEKEHAPEIPILNYLFDQWLEVCEPKNSLLMNQFVNQDIHIGEAQVIALAYELHQETDELIVILDDLSARNLAKVIGLKYSGTLGIILRAVKEGFITSLDAKNYLNLLIKTTNFRISAEIYSDTLNQLNLMDESNK